MDREIPKSERRKAALRKILIWGGAAAVVGTGIAITLSLLNPSVKRSDLIVGTAEVQTLETTVSCSGRISPAFEEIIISPISSRIIDVYAHAGDSLHEGDPILLLDLSATTTDLEKISDNRSITTLGAEQTHLANVTNLKDLEMQVSIKEMEVGQARQQWLNEIYLDSLGSGSGEKVEEARLAYERSRLQLQQLRVRLENETHTARIAEQTKQLEVSIASRNEAAQSRLLADARVKAPRNAVLTSISASIGQPVNQGDRLATIADLTRFKAEGEAADIYAPFIRPGASTTVKVGSKNYHGMVSYVEAASSDGMLRFSVLLDEDSQGLRPGVRANLYVTAEEIPDALTIPRFTDYTEPGKYRLFVFTSDSELEPVTVTLGAANYDRIEVKSGLSAGDRVVLTSLRRFENARALKVK